MWSDALSALDSSEWATLSLFLLLFATFAVLLLWIVDGPSGKEIFGLLFV